MQKNRFILPALIFGIALIISMVIFSFGLKNIRNAEQIINTTGSAKKLIVSDIGILSGTLQSTGNTAKEAYQNLQIQKPVLIKYLKEKGFSEKDIQIKTLNSYPNYNYNNQGQQTGINYYSSTQNISIESKDVDLIKEISLDISSLIEEGINFSVNSPEYYFTKIGDIKIEIQAEAAKDAMIRGQKIAEATGRSLGTLKSARMGVIQITPENSNTISDYGMNDVSSIRKEITAVVNAQFEIK